MAYPVRSRSGRGSSSTPAPYVPAMAPPKYKAPYPGHQQYSYATPPARGMPQAPTRVAQPPQPMQPPPAVYHPETYPSGPLGFFLPPPGQRSFDPTLQTPPVTQACYTTYPSRLRTGATSLIQPEHVLGGPKEREAHLNDLDNDIGAARSSGANTPRIDSPAPGRPGRTTTTTMSGRRAGRVSYVERDESDEEEESSEEEIEEAASDPDDDTYGERRRRRERETENTMRINRQVRRKQAEAEPGWTWLGDRVPADRVRSEVAKVARHKFIPEEALSQEASRPELLVPITLDLDIPSEDGRGVKIRDRFMWNANEPFYKPLEFATMFCDDIGISTSNAQTLADLIQTQLDEAQGTVAIDLVTEDATPDDVTFSDEEVEAATQVEEYERWTEPDCRVVVNLDVQIFTHVLRDRIEWDLASSLPPAEFARHYCAEMGLTGEAIPLVTHAIHEELIKHKRDALELELFSHTHPQEQAKWEKGQSGTVPRTNSRYGARGLVGVWRDWWERDEFSPTMVELTSEDMVKRDHERSRESRRMMRTAQQVSSKRRRY